MTTNRRAEPLATRPSRVAPRAAHPVSRLLHPIPRFYPIADSGGLARFGLSLEEGAIRLLNTGVRWLQLRAKDLPSGEFLEIAVSVVAAAQAGGARVLINDRVDIAIASGAHGVHLGQGDLDPHQARELLGPEAIVGWSTHSLRQGLCARKFPADYVAVGPVSVTLSKTRPDPVVPVETLPALAGALRCPLVAIGGIQPVSAAGWFAKGASSVAVISSFLAEGELEQGVARFHSALAAALPIALVGFMGAGKSSTGRLLANRIGCEFLDLDAEIERVTQRSPADWIRCEGEPAFRIQELRVLRKVLEGPAVGRGAILACGGGILESFESARLLRARAFTVWLDAPFVETYARIGSDQPLLPENREEAQRLFLKRRPRYAQADLRLDIEGFDISQAARALQHLKLNKDGGGKPDRR